jgi:FAD/FMN-containing dehydrogenase
VTDNTAHAATSTADRALDVNQVRSIVRGRVSAPGDPTYDAERLVQLGGVDARPAVIVRVADAADVAAVIGLARDTGLELAVRSGGHSGAGHSTTEGGIVLDVRDLRGLEVDVPGRTAWVGAGLTAGDVTRELAPHGLAIGFGDTGSVGVAGITLGGGIGYLVRAHGMTIDSLLAVELVTAAGEVLHVDDESDAELFWALRGGGGNLGVVTRFRFRLAPVAGIVGGMLVQPASAASVEAFMAAAQAAPDGLSAIANVMPCPPLPFVDEASHGTLVLFSLVCWSGPADEADAALAPLRAVAAPLADLLRPMSYPEMYPPEDPDYHPLAVARTLFMDSVDGDDARTIIDRLEACDAPMRAVQLRALGGAMARVPADATAFAHRDRAILGNVAAFYSGPDDRAARTAWVEETTALLRDGEAAYVNFLADEGPSRVHDAYPPATYARLAAVKTRVDPGNLFRRNQNVVPASA